MPRDLFLSPRPFRIRLVNRSKSNLTQNAVVFFLWHTHIHRHTREPVSQLAHDIDIGSSKTTTMCIIKRTRLRIINSYHLSWVKCLLHAIKKRTAITTTATAIRRKERKKHTIISVNIIYCLKNILVVWRPEWNPSEYKKCTHVKEALATFQLKPKIHT